MVRLVPIARLLQLGIVRESDPNEKYAVLSQLPYSVLKGNPRGTNRENKG